MLNLKGKTLGRYHLVEPLGEGGMAVVYKAYDATLDRDVAIKVIRTEMGSDPSFLARFQREARSLARLDHPYILKVLDYGEQEGMPYLVMPFVAGGTLKARMGKPFPPEEVSKILAPIASALAYAHQQGIIHRDVKPANILITPTGAPILSDFGIAKLLETEGKTQLTATGVGMGTPDYMAPEQWLGTTDARTDIYALGVILYQMTTGRLPYQADTPAAVLLKHMQDPLPRPRDFVPGLPDTVEHVIFKALAKNSADRFQDMGQFAAALERLSTGAAQSPDVTLAAPPSEVSSMPTIAAPAYPPQAGQRSAPLGLPAQPTIAPVNPPQGKTTRREAPLREATWRKAPWLWIGIGALVLIGLICGIGAGALTLMKNRLLPGAVTPTAQIALATQPPASPGADATATQAPNLPNPTAVQAAEATATKAGPTPTPTKHPPLTKIEGLPEDVPLLPDNNGDLITQDSNDMKLFMYSTSLPYDQVAEYFKTEMLKRGWTVQNTTTMAAQNSIMYSFEKNGRMAMINCATANGQTMVQTMLPKDTP